MRLDLAVLSKVSDLNRSAVRKLIKSGLVKVNGKVLMAPGKNISDADKIKISPRPKNSRKAVKFSPKILYQDGDCIVLDKTAGILTHSKGDLLDEPTVASWLADYLGIKPRTNRDLIVHRLDRGTSGVIICAKSEEAKKKLQKEFSTRKVQKKYTAIVGGIPSLPEALIDAAIERNPKQPSRFRVSENGKSALTRYKTLDTTDSKKPMSTLSLQPATGRTHQIRVHMNYIGHPVVGDEFYGGQPADRMYLHASSLKIKLPSGQTKEFTSKLPSEFANLDDKSK